VIYEAELERIDVALKAMVALVKKPRRGDGWKMLESLGVDRIEAEIALTYFMDSDLPLRGDDDFAALLLICPTLLTGALNMLGKYVAMCGESRVSYYATARGRRIA
jgi:hypothetical protein